MTTIEMSTLYLASKWICKTRLGSDVLVFILKHEHVESKYQPKIFKTTSSLRNESFPYSSLRKLRKHNENVACCVCLQRAEG